LRKVLFGGWGKLAGFNSAFGKARDKADEPAANVPAFNIVTPALPSL
jgi:hypothetical protein